MRWLVQIMTLIQSCNQIVSKFYNLLVYMIKLKIKFSSQVEPAGLFLNLNRYHKVLYKVKEQRLILPWGAQEFKRKNVMSHRSYLMLMKLCHVNRLNSSVNGLLHLLLDLMLIRGGHSLKIRMKFNRWCTNLWQVLRWTNGFRSGSRLLRAIKILHR